MKYFSTLLPPPNLTGILHLGHTGNAILQDTLYRKYLADLGSDNCYGGFGVDHAGISLQIKVEENLRNSGIRKEDLSVEEFQTKLGDGKEIHEKKIIQQYSKLGFLLPGREQRFTLDSKSLEYTLSVFKKLYEDNLIYRDEKLINGDTKLKTAISDMEIEHRETSSKIYIVKYYYSENEYISVHTTRPETILGDTAIFVHPDDERYKSLLGKKVKVPLVDRYIEIMADEYIDPNFGSGAMKCSPAHDFQDYVLGKKYSLPSIQVFDTDMNMLVEPYTGIPKDEAKKLIINALLDQGLVSSQDYISNIAYSSRSGSIIEPLLSKQGFVKSSVLAKEVLKYGNENPDQFKVTKSTKDTELRTILENMEDGCISRQLEWGIKIPVYLNGDQHSIEPKPGFKASEDVLDTGFSSSLGPCIVFQDMKSFLPLTTLISGRDILLFWISRMMFMSYYAEKIIPFKTVFLHGLVLDSDNRKMSKSLNNGIDPIDLMKEYSRDIVRLFFLNNTRQDHNISFSKQSLDKYSKFIHKLRNAYEFVKKHKEKAYKQNKELILNLNEQQILYFLRELKNKLEKRYENFMFAEVVDELMDFARDRFCNQYLELYKHLHKHNKNTPGFLFSIGNELVFLLSPIIPDFANEVTISKQTLDLNALSINEFKRIDIFFEYLNYYSEIRKNLSISTNEKFEVKLSTPFPSQYEYLFEYLAYINHNVSYLGVEEIDNGEEDVVFAVYEGDKSLMASIKMNNSRVLKYKSLVDERVMGLKKEIDFLTNRLKGFNNKTPKHMVNEVGKKLENYQRDLKFFEDNYEV